MIHFRLKKIIKDRNDIRYLITNKFKIFPSVKIRKFIESMGYIIYDRSESIDTVNSRSIFKIKKLNLDCIIALDVSRDHLMTCTLNGDILNKIITRDLDEVISFLENNLNNKNRR